MAGLKKYFIAQCSTLSKSVRRNHHLDLSLTGLESLKERIARLIFYFLSGSSLIFNLVLCILNQL